MIVVKFIFRYGFRSLCISVKVIEWSVYMSWILCMLKEKRSQSILLLKNIVYESDSLEYGCLLSEDRNLFKGKIILFLIYFTLLGKIMVFML